MATRGTVKWFNSSKGFGFIETEAGESVFFHVSEFKAQRRPNIGEAVVFSIGQDAQGRKRATQVQDLGFVQQKMAQNCVII